MGDSAEVNSAVQPGENETTKLNEIDLLRKDIELLKMDNQNVKKDIQDVKKQNELILAKLNELGESKKSEDYRQNLKSYWGLPIPKLTLECDVNGWFEMYRKVMRTQDQEVLMSCVGYYLDDEVAVVFSKGSYKNYRSIYYIENDLSENVNTAMLEKKRKQRRENEEKKEEYLENYREIVQVAKRELSRRN